MCGNSTSASTSLSSPVEYVKWARARLENALRAITVEPVIVCYVMAALICAPALYNLEFEKACRVNLFLNDTICDRILAGSEPDRDRTENGQIQILIGGMHSWQLPLQSVMPLVLILFLGSYSDRYRVRRPFLIMPIVGELLAVVGCILCVLFMRDWPLEAVGVCQTVVPSFFGGQAMLIMAVFAYVADVSTVEMRTLRVGAVQLVLNICTPLTQSFSGVLFEYCGYFGVLGVGGALFLLGLLYAIYWLEEPSRGEVVVSVRSGCDHLKDVFDPEHALDTFRVLVTKRPGNRRQLIWIIMGILFVYSTVNSGEASVFYLYTQRVFHWTPLEYSYCITTNTVIHLIGTVIGIPLFTRVLQLNDWLIVMVTFLDKCVTNVILGLAQTVIVLYFGLFVSLITGLSTIAIRSLATKVVSNNDLGKAQSLFGICEALGPAIAVPIYNKGIYIPTLDTFPGSYFFLGIVLYAICITVILSLYYRERTTESDHSDTSPNRNNTKSTETEADNVIEITHI